MKEWREIDGFPNYMVSNTGEMLSNSLTNISQSFNTLKQENF